MNHAVSVPLTTAIVNPDEAFTLEARIASDNGVTRTMKIEEGAFLDASGDLHVFGTAGDDTITVDDHQVVINGETIDPRKETINFLDDAPADWLNGQVISGTTTVRDAGATVELTGNVWSLASLGYQVTSNTVIEFDFASNSQGEFHGLAFTNTTSQYNAPHVRYLKVHGSQATWPDDTAIDVASYTGASAVQSYRVPLGKYLTAGTYDYIGFVNNDKVIDFMLESLRGGGLTR